MNAAVSLKLLNITQQFIADKQKATEFVQLLEETIEDKFDNESGVLATKEDLVREIGNVRVEIKETKADILKWLIALFLPFYIGMIVFLIKQFA